MARWRKKLPYRELTIPFKMLAGRLSNRGRHITPFRPLTLKHGSLQIVDGVPVAHVRGTPREMGRALGTLVGVQATETFHCYMRHFCPDMQGDLELAREMETRMPEWFIEEMRGFAETSELTYDELLLGQTFLDIHKVALCSTIAVHDRLTVDGEMLLGRNLDFPSLSIAHEANMVVVHEPDDGPAYAGVTWPGFLGILTGLNQRGLALSMMLVYGPHKHEHLDGQPFPLVFRRLLRECAGVRQADELLQTRPFCTRTNLVLADATRTAARFQLHPQHPVVEYTSEQTPAATCTNHYFDRRIKTFAFTWFSSVVRHNKLVRRVKRDEPFDVPAIKRALQATGIPTINLQRTIIRPERLDMEVSFKNNGRGPGHWIKLSKELLFPNATLPQPVPDEAEAVAANTP